MNLLLVSLLNRTVYVVCFQTFTVGVAKVCCSEYLQRAGYKYVPTFRGYLIRTMAPEVIEWWKYILYKEVASILVVARIGHFPCNVTV